MTSEGTAKCDEIRRAFDRERRDLDIPGFTRHADASCVYHKPRTGSGGFVSYSDSPPEETESLICTVIDAFVRSRSSEFEWKVFEHDRPTDLRARLERRGFRSGAREELMVMPVELVSGLHGCQSARIEHVGDSRGLSDYFSVAATHWSGDDGMDALRNELRENPDDLALYVAYDGKHPVASAYARFSKGSRFAGLWAAVTLPTHRRRGIYSALVAARALEAARRGFDFVMVDARAESSSILKRLGFLCVTASHACVWTQGAAR